jgi:hypothetical protein
MVVAASTGAVAINVGFALNILEGRIYLFLSTFAIGILTGFATSSVFGSIRSAMRTSESALSLSRLSDDELSRTLVEIKKSEPATHDAAYLRLMSDLRLIEKHGTRLLTETGSPPSRRRSFLALRSGLFDLGIWTDDDARRFDEALRVRNALVHGDLEDASEDKVLSAARITSDLLGKLRAIDSEARH